MEVIGQVLPYHLSQCHLCMALL